jgi:hypothetical protein
LLPPQFAITNILGLDPLKMTAATMKWEGTDEQVHTFFYQTDSELD